MRQQRQSLSRTGLAAVFVFLAFALPARAVIDRIVEKTFELTPDAVVRADTFSGGIIVKNSADGLLRVIVRQTVEATDERAASALLEKLSLSLDATPQSGAAKTVTLRLRPRHAVRWSWQNWSPAALALELEVPAGRRLELRTSEGAITVGPWRGQLAAETEAGAIFIGEFDGTISARSQRGDVAVTACSGKLTLAADAGNVLVGRTHARAELRATDGVVEVQSARGAVFAKGDRSDVKIGFVHPVTEESALSADGGDVTATFDPRSAVTIQAKASRFGDVRARDLELKARLGRLGGSSLIGTINGGGPVIRLRASGGNVRLSGVPAP
jgi:hypothetical protein